MGAKVHTLLALLMKRVATVTLSSLKQVLAEVKYDYPIWFTLLHPH